MNDLLRAAAGQPVQAADEPTEPRTPKGDAASGTGPPTPQPPDMNDLLRAVAGRP